MLFEGAQGLAGMGADARAAIAPQAPAWEPGQRPRALGGGRLAYRLAKRAFDVAFSAAALVALVPLFVVVAIAIRLDDHGPAIFVQVRVGRDGRPFRMYKFRSMRVDAEDRLDSLRRLNEKDGPVFKMREDPRVTRVGRFIRRTSIDETPQFLNVLLGQMSLVGPRPALPGEVAQYGERERRRLAVRPGLTCYWQATRDRDSLSFDDWMDLDLRYIRERGPLVDLGLMARTVGVMFGMQGN